MTVDLDKEDMIKLLKGTGGPPGYRAAEHFSMLGKLHGFPNEKWYWNDTYLQVCPIETIWDYYQQFKAWKE